MAERELDILKTRAANKSSCMTTSQCMTEGCPNGKSPTNCFLRLGELRTQIQDVTSALFPQGGEAWTGKFSIKSSNNTRR